ncbi:MAG: hypothetical protein ACOX17_03855 [Christensenellales bacterium]|jgi:hypothetical protein
MGLLILLCVLLLAGILFTAAFLAVRAFRLSRRLIGWLYLAGGLLLACIPGYYILVLLLIGGIT